MTFCLDPETQGKPSAENCDPFVLLKAHASATITLPLTGHPAVSSLPDRGVGL